MIRLLVDGQEVALSVDFSCEFYSQNPFFTKNGDYTYDIDIDLNNGNNRLIYQHINRADCTKRPDGRRVVITSGPIVILRGLEVILSVEDNIVKIQVIADNSELNYLSAGNLTLRQMDLGYIRSGWQEYNRLNMFYPQSSYVCCPVLLQKGNYNISDFTPKTDVIYNEIEWDTSGGIQYKSGTEMMPQPFLLYCIDKIIEALGYSIVENVLAQDTLACKLIVVNGVHSDELSKLLPDWEVDKFITEIEKFFNVMFLADTNTKQVRILKVYDYYQSAQYQYINAADLIDEVNKKFDQSESLYITYDYIKFKLPSTPWYKYQAIPQDIKDKCGKTSAYFYEMLGTSIEQHPYRLWYEAESRTTIIQNAIRTSDGSFNNWVICDELAAYGNEADNACEMAIIPAETYNNNVWITKGDFGGSKYYDGWITHILPVIANVSSSDKKDYAFEEIENGVSQEETNNSNIFISIYLGTRPYLYSSYYLGQEVPQPGIDAMKAPFAVACPWAIHSNRGAQNFKLTKVAETDMSLAIETRYGGLFQRYYQQNVKVDTKTEYIFKFKTNKILDVKSIFVIANKKYYCKELHYTVKANGLDSIVEGTFYLMD